MKPTLQDLITSLPEPLKLHIHHLERMRQDFVANVSHELRTPLTVLHGYLEVLIEQTSKQTEPWQKIFVQMQQQTLRMENLIDDLLLLSHLENAEQNFHDESEVDISAMLVTITEEAKILSNDKKHSFNLSLDEKLKLRGSASELRSLFSNLIFNAVKYTLPEGKITICWDKKDNYAVFSVQDSGIGIAAEHIPRLTERFYRIDAGRSRSSGGTGLGLAIAKHVLIRHQATLDIKSKIGKGSTFICKFPLR